LEDKYLITTDWTGTLYIGLTLAWDYKARTVDLSMPGYVTKALERFQHPPPKRPQHSPHDWQAPQYGVKTQLTDEADTSHYYRRPASSFYSKSLALSCTMQEQ
jgi:hypothetical protein